MTSLAELDEAMALCPDAVLLDNMDRADAEGGRRQGCRAYCHRSVRRRNPRHGAPNRRDRRRPHFRRGAHAFGAHLDVGLDFDPAGLTMPARSRLILPQLLRRSCAQPPPGHIKTPRSVAVALVEALPPWISYAASSSGGLIALASAFLGGVLAGVKNRDYSFWIVVVLLCCRRSLLFILLLCPSTRACVRASPRSTSRSGAAGGKRDSNASSQSQLIG